jgi:hypothetical protein
VVSIRTVSLLERLRRRGPASDSTDVDDDTARASQVPTRLPDPSKPPAPRGSWEQAALTNIAITELVKREIGTVTPPWVK